MQSLTQSSSHDAFRLQRITDTQRVPSRFGICISCHGTHFCLEKTGGWLNYAIPSSTYSALLTLNKAICHFRATDRCHLVDSI